MMIFILMYSGCFSKKLLVSKQPFGLFYYSLPPPAIGIVFKSSLQGRSKKIKVCIIIFKNRSVWLPRCHQTGDKPISRRCLLFGLLADDNEITLTFAGEYQKQCLPAWFYIMNPENKTDKTEKIS